MPVNQLLAIGLNYPNSPYKLGGCENDATEISKRVMMTHKFNAQQRSGIYTANHFYIDVSELRRRAKPSTTTVIMQSGHGTQLPVLTEKDGWEGGLCYWNGSEIEVIRESDFLRLIGEIPGTVILYLDVCFAGEMIGAQRNVINPKGTKKFIPFNPAWSVFGVPKTGSRGAVGWLAKGSNKIYKILACQPNEVSWDTGTAGWFTQNFCKSSE